MQSSLPVQGYTSVILDSVLDVSTVAVDAGKQSPCILPQALLNPTLCQMPLQADGAHLVTVSRVAVAVWAVIMGIAMCIAQVANINVNWLVLLIGALSCDSSPLCHVSHITHGVQGEVPVMLPVTEWAIITRSAMCIAQVADANLNCLMLLIGAAMLRQTASSPSGYTAPGDA